MSVAELTQKAREEIKRVRFGEALDRSMAYADNVLKRLVNETTGKQTFHDFLPSRGNILIEQKNGTKFTLCLDIVDKDYMLDLSQIDVNVKPQILFLLNTVKLLYYMLKNAAKLEYTLQIANNTTLYLEENCPKRIGVILKKT